MRPRLGAGWRSGDGGHEIDYVEFQSADLERTQAFFAQAFGWTFVEYGDDYRDVRGAGIGGGIERGGSEPPLPVVRSHDLEATLAAVREAGAEITRDIFEFPGGRRFHFREPGGNEMAAWSES